MVWRRSGQSLETGAGILVVGERVDRGDAGFGERAFGIEKDLGAMNADDFVCAIREEIATKGAKSVRDAFVVAGA